MPPLSLHLAIWDDNLTLLTSLLERGTCDLEEVDQHGDTPLLLAYRLRHLEAARMLLAAGAFSKQRTRPHGFESVQVAGLTADTTLVRTAVLAYLKETDAAIERRLSGMWAALEAMPDFTLRMSWDFASWVPLVSRLLPSDTWTIYKRGSSVRLDSTLLQMNGLTWERGSQTVLIWGRDMPHPGASYVLDNDLKGVADTRLALTHPSDISQQDWIRKLITSKHKVTDFWSRDARIVPVLKQSMFGSLTSALSRAVLGDDVPRGRQTESATSPKVVAGSPSPKSSQVMAASGGPPSPSPTPTPAAASVEVDATDPRIVREDVGVWHGCTSWELKNLCVRDITHPPVRAELPLAEWWRPELSVAASDSDVAAVQEAAAGGGPKVVSEDPPPEAKLGLLNAALQAILDGKLKELQAGTVPDGTADGTMLPSAASSVRSFTEYFGLPREAPDSESAWAMPPAEGLAHYVHVADGLLHKPTAVVAEHRASSLTIDDKTMDMKMYFSDRFPITPEQFLPVAELMARTSAHASNFRAFFERKMPRGAGFPVKFSIPVYPTITATVTFDYMSASHSPPASLFVVPSDFSFGKYVERGWVRQL